MPLMFLVPLPHRCHFLVLIKICQNFGQIWTLNVLNLENGWRVSLLFTFRTRNEITSSYPGWIKSPHVVTLSILKLSDLDSLTIFIGRGYSGVNFGHPKSEVFQNGGGGYSGVNFGHPKSEVFQNGGYSGVNFGHPKSEVFQNGGWGILE